MPIGTKANTTTTADASSSYYNDDSYFTFDEREELTTFQEFLTCQDPELMSEPATHTKKADHFDLLAKAISHTTLVQSYKESQARDDDHGDLALEEEDDDEEEGENGGETRGLGPGPEAEAEAENRHHDIRQRQQEGEVELRHIEDEETSFPEDEGHQDAMRSADAASVDAPSSVYSEDEDDEMALNEIFTDVDNGNDTDVATNVSGSAVSSSAGSGFKPVICDEEVAFYVKQSQDIMQDVKTSCMVEAAKEKEKQDRMMAQPKLKHTRSQSMPSASSFVKSLVDKIETPPNSDNEESGNEGEPEAGKEDIEEEQHPYPFRRPVVREQPNIESMLKEESQEQKQWSPSVAVKAIIQKMEGDEGAAHPPTPSSSTAGGGTSVGDESSLSSSFVKKMIQSWNRAEAGASVPQTRSATPSSLKKIEVNKAATTKNSKSPPQVAAKRVMTPSKMEKMELRASPQFTAPTAPTLPKEAATTVQQVDTTKEEQEQKQEHEAHVNAFSPARKRVVEIRKKKVASKAVELGKLHHHHHAVSKKKVTSKKKAPTAKRPASCTTTTTTSSTTTRSLLSRPPSPPVPSSKEMMMMLKRNGIVSADSNCSTDHKGPAVERLANMYDDTVVLPLTKIMAEQITPPLSKEQQKLQEMMTPKAANKSTSSATTTKEENKQLAVESNNTVESSIRVSGGTRRIIITIDFPPEASKFLPANGELNPKVTVKLQDE